LLDRTRAESRGLRAQIVTFKKTLKTAIAFIPFNSLP
jgi:hypothetical protein